MPKSPSRQSKKASRRKPAESWTTAELLVEIGLPEPLVDRVADQNQQKLAIALATELRNAGLMPQEQDQLIAAIARALDRCARELSGPIGLTSLSSHLVDAAGLSTKALSTLHRIAERLNKTGA